MSDCLSLPVPFSLKFCCLLLLHPDVPDSGCLFVARKDHFRIRILPDLFRYHHREHRHFLPRRCLNFPNHRSGFLHHFLPDQCFLRFRLRHFLLHRHRHLSHHPNKFVFKRNRINESTCSNNKKNIKNIASNNVPNCNSRISTFCSDQ